MSQRVGGLVIAYICQITPVAQTVKKLCLAAVTTSAVIVAIWE